MTEHAANSNDDDKPTLDLDEELQYAVDNRNAKVRHANRIRADLDEKRAAGLRRRHAEKLANLETRRQEEGK